MAVFLTSWGTYHTAVIERGFTGETDHRQLVLRPAKPHEVIDTVMDMPDPDGFVDGLIRAYNGRKYDYDPAEIMLATCAAIPLSRTPTARGGVRGGGPGPGSIVQHTSQTDERMTTRGGNAQRTRLMNDSDWEFYLAAYRAGATADMVQAEIAGEWGPIWTIPPARPRQRSERVGR
jgi:hypothetical protein